MTDISKGDWVQAARDADFPQYGLMPIRDGNVYFIDSVTRPGLTAPTPIKWVCGGCGDVTSDPRILHLLGEKVDPHYGWCACYFKPLKRGPGSAVEATGGVSIPAGVRALDEALAGYSDGHAPILPGDERCPTTPAA